MKKIIRIILNFFGFEEKIKVWELHMLGCKVIYFDYDDALYAANIESEYQDEDIVIEFSIKPKFMTEKELDELEDFGGY